MTAPITVFVVDDHTLFRRGLIALIGLDEGLCVVGEAADAAEALRLVPGLQPQVILLDNHLPGVLGVDAIPDVDQFLKQQRERQQASDAAAGAPAAAAPQPAA